MATINRNAVIEALRSHLSAKLPGITVARRASEPQAEECPCLSVGVMVSQTNADDSHQVPPSWTLSVTCFAWTRDTSAAGPVPSMLDLIDVVEEALHGTGDGWWTNLGGIAWSAALTSIDVVPDAEALDRALAELVIEVRLKPVS